MPKLSIPTVHLNGTSKESLLEQLRRAVEAVNRASDAVSSASPHGRDYYVQADPDAFTMAARQHAARIIKLRDIAKELEDIAVGVLDQ
jgi:hypothetical protein